MPAPLEHVVREARVQSALQAGKAMIGNQILPDGHGIPATAKAHRDGFAIGLTGAGRSLFL